MYCPKCGALNDSQAKFCIRCGSLIDTMTGKIQEQDYIDKKTVDVVGVVRKEVLRMFVAVWVPVVLITLIAFGVDDEGWMFEFFIAPLLFVYIVLFSIITPFIVARKYGAKSALLVFLAYLFTNALILAYIS